MPRYLDLIKQLNLFSGLDPGLIEMCLQDGSCRVVSYALNQIIHFPGEPCTNLEIILSGQVVIERIDINGDLLVVADFSSGDILGGNLMFSQSPYFPMTVTAQKPTTILLMSKTKLLQLLRQNQVFLQKYLTYAADSTAILGDRLKHYVKRSIRESVSSYFASESKKQKSRRILLPLSKKQLAEKIGVQRTSLSRELAKMRTDGLISYQDRLILLLPAFFAQPAS